MHYLFKLSKKGIFLKRFRHLDGAIDSPEAYERAGKPCLRNVKCASQDLSVNTLHDSRRWTWSNDAESPVDEEL